MIHGFYQSPFGLSLIAHKNECIFYLVFVDDQKKSLLFFGEKYPNSQENTFKIKKIGDSIFCHLAENISIHLEGSSFQKEVWRALFSVPRGQTASYEFIADLIGHKKAVRAVATAIGQNDLSYIVPCHRIIRKNGHLGGYRWGLERKKLILDFEKKMLKNNLF